MKRIAAWSLVVLAGFAVSASAQPRAAGADPGRPLSSAPCPIFRVDPAIRLDKAEADAGWTNLGKISNTSVVAVQMRAGRVYRGTIQAVRPDSLEFLLGETAGMSVPLSDVKEVVGRLSKGHAVELRLREGRTVRGAVLEVESDSVRIAADDAMVQLNRQDVQRVWRDVRRRMQTIGTAAGVLVGAIVDATFVKQHQDAPPAYFLLLGTAGLAAGTFLPAEKTLWEHPAKRP